jgi:hypothetical protein
MLTILALQPGCDRLDGNVIHLPTRMTWLRSPLRVVESDDAFAGL